MALVYGSRGKLLSPLEMTFYNRVGQLFDGIERPARNWPPASFLDITKGRASVSSRVVTSSDEPLITGVLDGATSVATTTPGGTFQLFLPPDTVPATMTSTTVPLSTDLGITILVDGEPAPLFGVFEGLTFDQVNGVTPRGVIPSRMASFTVLQNGIPIRETAARALLSSCRLILPLPECTPFSSEPVRPSCRALMTRLSLRRKAHWELSAAVLHRLVASLSLE